MHPLHEGCLATWQGDDERRGGSRHEQNQACTKVVWRLGRETMSAEVEADMNRTERTQKDRTSAPSSADQPDQAGAHDFCTALRISCAWEPLEQHASISSLDIAWSLGKGIRRAIVAAEKCRGAGAACAAH